MKPKTPKALLNGHEYLFKDIEVIVSFGGEIGEKAKLLADISRPHFKKEEEYALPPLGLLSALADGSWQFESKAAIEMAKKLQTELLQMKKEHMEIFQILKNLESLAEKEKDERVKRFVNDLKLHIEVEEQVLYPATIFVGDYLCNPQLQN